ncbi:TetR family transcriptional regulator [Pelomonas sp. CA6]|uniref:TetR family transcriptional regulator n=1 Tax=Pelomonas sp. CA6 TaxID=2907999 RepID=UPI001F4C42AE|nr:TetR family transcriptional regulator [Pelomonas sp. CA6]MCH7344630.1 TetR family transcriptional regulator [Pelomonas sp. CA6]
MARKTKQEAQETRNRLLDAAEALFHARGVARTSLQDIAQAAGVTRGAVYWHFEDKVQLFNAMMERATLPLEEGFDPAPGTPSLADQPLEELRLGLLNVLYSAANNARTRRVFEISNLRMEFVGEMAAVQARKVAAHREWTGHNRESFERAVALGQLPKGLDCEQAAIGLMALVGGLLHHWILDPESFDLLEMGQSLLEGYLSTLRQPIRSTFAPLTEAQRARLGRGALCSRGMQPSEPLASPSEAPPAPPRRTPKKP